VSNGFFLLGVFSFPGALAFGDFDFEDEEDEAADDEEDEGDDDDEDDDDDGDDAEALPLGAEAAGGSLGFVAFLGFFLLWRMTSSSLSSSDSSGWVGESESESEATARSFRFDERGVVGLAGASCGCESSNSNCFNSSFSSWDGGTFAGFEVFAGFLGFRCTLGAGTSSGPFNLFFRCPFFEDSDIFLQKDNKIYTIDLITNVLTIPKNILSTLKWDNRIRKTNYMYILDPNKSISAHYV